MSVQTIRKAVFGAVSAFILIAVLAVTGYSNGLSIRTEPSGDGMNLIVSAPAGFSSRVEIYAFSNLVSGDWHVIADNLYPTEEHPAAWYTKTAGFNYFLAGNMDVDSDLDGLPDAREMFVYKTNPAQADTDADGIKDADELALGLDPKVADGGPFVMAGEADVILSNFVDTADNWAESTGEIYTYTPTATDSRIGTVAAGMTRKYVMPFWIPDLEGKQIVGAALRMTVKETMGSWIHGANADLYGIRSDATSPTVTTNDCFGGTQLVDSWFRIENLTAGQELITTNSALSTWLSEQVGTTGQKYVFLSAQPDAVTNAYWYTTVHTGDATNAAVRPVLILTLHDATPPPQQASTLYDDFSDGNYDVADGADGATWVVISGGADASHNYLAISRPGMIICDQQISANEFTIRFDASVSWAENDEARFMFLRKDPTNYYWLGLGGTGGVYRVMDGVQTTLYSDTNKTLQLSHDAWTTNTFKIYVKNTGSALDLKFDRDGNWTDYDVSLVDSNSTAAARFNNTGIGAWDASASARRWPDFHLDNVMVCTGLLTTAQNPPAVGSQTISFGSLTLANAGGAQAKAADGTYQNFDAIVAGISGDTNNWIISNGRLVSTIALSNRTASVLRCVAAGSTCDVTIAIDPGAADLATPLEFPAAFTLGDHGGQRFYFRPATSFDIGKIGNTMYNRMGGQSSEVVFGCRDAASPARLSYFYLGTAVSNRVQNLTFQNLHFVNTKSTIAASALSMMMNFGTGPVNEIMARNIKIEDNIFELDLGKGRLGDTVPFQGDMYALNFRTFAEKVTVRNNEFINHGISITFGNGCRDTLVEGNICRLAWNDFLRFAYTDVSDPSIIYPATERVRVAYNAVYDPAANNETRHVDTVQTFQANAAGYCPPMGDIELVGNLSFMGNEGFRQIPPLYPAVPMVPKAIHGNYTVQAYEFLGEAEASIQIGADTSSGPITVTLPDMQTVARWSRLYVAKISADSNPVTVVDPSGVFSTVVLSNMWEQNTFTKKASTNEVYSIRGITGPRYVSSNVNVTSNDFDNGSGMATAWKVDTTQGPVTIQMPDMATVPLSKTMTVSKMSADTNPVIIKMATGQTIALKTAATGAGTSATEYSMGARWMGVYMSKYDATTLSMVASCPNLAGFRIQSLMNQGDRRAYDGLAVVGNFMYTTDLLFRPDTVDNLVLAYNTGIQPRPGDMNGDGVVDIHDGYNPPSPETEWCYVTNGIRKPEAYGNISHAFGPYYLSPTNGVNLSAGNLQTKGYTNDAQYEALFDISSVDDLNPMTVQQAIDLSKTKSTGPGAAYGVHQLINFSTRADGRGLTGTFKDNSAPAAPTASVLINGTNATIIITPNGTNAVHEYGSRVWYLVDSSASHTYKEITEQGKSLYVRGSSNEVVTAELPITGTYYLHMARRSINTQTVVSEPVSLSGLMVPAAGFSASPTSGTAPLTVTFTDSSSGSITNRYWNFGDGTVTNTMATSLTHTYSANGSFTASLTVSGPNGTDTDTQNGLISVATPPPVAGFSASPVSGSLPLAVTFTDTSSGSITNRHWNFGDGVTANITATSIVHTYMSTGVYTVALTVSGPDGSGTVTHTNAVSVSALVTSTNFVITADGNDQQWSGTNSATATSAWYANPAANTGSGGLPSLTKYVIPFQLPALPSGHAITNVSLSVFLTSGYIYGSPQEVYVDVYAGRVASTSTTAAGDWDYGTKVGDNIAKISSDFTATNQVRTVALTASYLQSIYDNDPSAAGKYIFLTLGPDAMPQSGSSFVNWATANHTTLAKPTLSITTAVQAPVAGFSASPVTGSVPLTVTFTDTSSGSITNRFWNFGDGSTTNVMTTSMAHTYTSSGAYTVALTVSGPGGSGTVTQTNVISISAGSSTNFVITANGNDQQWTGTNSTSATSAWYGNPGSNTGSGSLPALTKFVIPFQLPALPAGQTITNVSLSVFLVSGYIYGAPQEVYVDVYAGRISTNSTAVAGDWDYGTKVGDNIAKISSDFTATNQVRTVSLTASYFQSIYNGDTNAAGKYIFLTMGPDAMPQAGSSVVNWATANHTTLAKPVLTITAGN